jgi:hypothetical protein
MDAYVFCGTRKISRGVTTPVLASQGRWIRPRGMGHSPPSVRNRLDLPLALGPVTTMLLPGCTAKLKSRAMQMPPGATMSTCSYTMGPCEGTTRSSSSSLRRRCRSSSTYIKSVTCSRTPTNWPIVSCRSNASPNDLNERMTVCWMYSPRADRSPPPSLITAASSAKRSAYNMRSAKAMMSGVCLSEKLEKKLKRSDCSCVCAMCFSKSFRLFSAMLCSTSSPPKKATDSVCVDRRVCTNRNRPSKSYSTRRSWRKLGITKRIKPAPKAWRRARENVSTGRAHGRRQNPPCSRS